MSSRRPEKRGGPRRERSRARARPRIIHYLRPADIISIVQQQITKEIIPDASRRLITAGPTPARRILFFTFSLVASLSSRLLRRHPTCHIAPAGIGSRPSCWPALPPLIAQDHCQRAHPSFVHTPYTCSEQSSARRLATALPVWLHLRPPTTLHCTSR